MLEHDVPLHHTVLPARVTDVGKPLMAVVDMCLHNKRVVFDIVDGKDCSYYENKKTGTRTRLGFTGRSWYLDLDVVDHDDVPENVAKVIRDSISAVDAVDRQTSAATGTSARADGPRGPQRFNIGTPRKLERTS